MWFISFQVNGTGTHSTSITKNSISAFHKHYSFIPWISIKTKHNGTNLESKQAHQPKFGHDKVISLNLIILAILPYNLNTSAAKTQQQRPHYVLLNKQRFFISYISWTFQVGHQQQKLALTHMLHNILPIPAPRTLFQSQFFNIHATKIAASQVSHRRSTRCVPRAVVHSIFYSYCGKNLIMQKLFPP